jgi:hypothetical protein
MRSAYRVIARLVALGVVLQASFVALGWFLTLNDIDGGQVVDKAFMEDEGWNIGLTLHSAVGLMVMPLLALVLLIVSFFAKIPGGVKWAGFVLLAVVAQVVLALVSFSAPVVGALHGINAFIVLGVAEFAARQASADAVVATPGTPEPAAV